VRIRSIVIAGALCLVVGGTTASAQTESGPRGLRRKDSVPGMALSLRSASQQAQPAPSSRDSLLNGALIGGAIGAGFAIADYAVDPSEPSNAAITVVAVGLGAAIGAGVDALIHKDRVGIMPVVTKRRGEVRVAVRF
jgi:hypothetical protein